MVTTGLTYPWGLAFLPDGDILVTERLGSLRRIRHGVLDPTPIAGVPEVSTGPALSGLMDVAIHPRFAETRLVYLTYSKPSSGGDRVALARGRLEGDALADVDELFVADAEMNAGASRLAFAPDGTLYMTLGGAFGGLRPLAQDPASAVGKVLRLRDDGTAPDDNPFVGRDGYRPEVFSLGHRNPMGTRDPPRDGRRVGERARPDGGRRGQISSCRAATMAGRWSPTPGSTTERAYPSARGRKTWSSRRSSGYPPSRLPDCSSTAATGSPPGAAISSPAR